MNKITKLILSVIFIFTILSSPAKAEEQVEEFEFQAEVGRLMDILINSLYTHKEIFLRELISNASDALDKIRFLSIQNPDILAENKDLEIRVEFDKEAETVSIIDTGVGMTKNDLIQNLGTIAKSGTTNFMEAIKSGSLNIIGQFGVGFYSSFLVGQKVTVTSKHNDDDQWIWESSAANQFSLQKDPEGNTLGRGTRITIHLKQEAHEFLEEKTLKELIKKYSEFINFDIKLKTSKTVEKEVVDEEAEAEIVDGETKQPMKTVKETVWEWTLMNDNKAIWLRDKAEIQDDEYVAFYKSMTKDYDDPLNWIHFRAEGDLEFTSLLYIPKRAPHDLFDNYYSSSSSLKLYVRRVLINEEFEELMPRYLSFVKGVIDSDDLPINVSRESIQQLKMLKVMSRKLVRKTLEMIQKMADAHRNDDESEYETVSEDYSEEEEDENQEKKSEKEEKSDEEEDEEDEEEKNKRKQEKIEKYNEFWKEFGKSIKLGIIEDSSNREKLAKCSRWYSSNNTEELTSLQDYIERSKPGQEHIYFLAGETKEALMKHPVLQKLLKKGYEVLILDDPIDEFTFQHLNEFEKKKLQNVSKGDFKFPEDSDEERKKFKKLKKMFKPLTTWWKKLISTELEEVRLSQRLLNDPCVVVSTEQGQSSNMERISRAQAYGNQDRSNPYANSKKILEINPSHPAIKEILERVKDDVDRETEELARVLYEGALVNSGYGLANPSDFSERFYRLFNSALGIPKDAPIEDIEVDLEEDSDEEENNKGDEDEEQDLDDPEMDPMMHDDMPPHEHEDL